jgi:hypothetical protein
MRSDHYLDHPDRRVRRWSAVAYSIATGAATLAWSAWGGLDALRDDKWLEALAGLVTTGLPVWLVAAGIGLRIVRRFARRREPVDQLVG